MKLFVGGLAFAANEGDLEKAFGSFGKLREVKIILDRETGRSRGFAFVTFERAEDAKEAMAVMDGARIAGRAVRVNEAENKPRPEADRSFRPPSRPVEGPSRESLSEPSVESKRRRALPPEHEFVDRRGLSASAGDAVEEVVERDVTGGQRPPRRLR